MAFFRRMGGQIALLVLAFASLVVSVYLTLVHYSSSIPLVCATGGLVNCERVLISIYSYVPGTTIPIAIPGILWSLVAIALALTLLRRSAFQDRLFQATVAWAGIGMLSVFYLVYVELVLVRAICLWCTVVHVLVLLYFLIALVLMQAPQDDDVELEDEHQTSLISSRTR